MLATDPHGPRSVILGGAATPGPEPQSLHLPETLAGLHLVAFVILMLRRAGDLAMIHNSFL